MTCHDCANARTMTEAEALIAGWTLLGVIIAIIAALILHGKP
jgi:hypothetical protein